MNKKRRKQIADIADKAEALKAAVDELLSEEQEGYNNLPESLQDGEKGETIQQAIENLENASSSLEEVNDYLLAAMEG